MRYVFTLMLTLLCGTTAARAGQWIDLPIGPTNGNATVQGNRLVISEKAFPGAPVQVVLSWLDPKGGNSAIDDTNGNGPSVNPDGSIVGGAVKYKGGVVWGGTGFVPAGGVLKFTFPATINKIKVTDYHQQTGDPGILSAAAFSNGVMMGLDDFLIANGNVSDTAGLIQPDFLLANGDPIFYAVDLAKLGASGAMLANVNAFGANFTIGANDSVPGLTGYQFSTTMPVYSPGQGWSVTAPAPGTVVQYQAFHNISVSVPEPSALLLLTLGLSGLAAARRLSRASAQTPTPL